MSSTDEDTSCDLNVARGVSARRRRGSCQLANWTARGSETVHRNCVGRANVHSKERSPQQWAGTNPQQRDCGQKSQAGNSELRTGRLSSARVQRHRAESTRAKLVIAVKATPLDYGTPRASRAREPNSASWHYIKPLTAPLPSRTKLVHISPEGRRGRRPVMTTCPRQDGSEV
jgi:hypothetical protein